MFVLTVVHTTTLSYHKKIIDCSKHDFNALTCMWQSQAKPADGTPCLCWTNGTWCATGRGCVCRHPIVCTRLHSRQTSFSQWVFSMLNSNGETFQVDKSFTTAECKWSSTEVRQLGHICNVTYMQAPSYILENTRMNFMQAGCTLN